MDIYTEIFLAPAHWATALIYGDYTPIDDDNEVERIQAFEASLPGPVSGVMDVEFMRAFKTDTPNELDGEYAQYVVVKES